MLEHIVKAKDWLEPAEASTLDREALGGVPVSEVEMATAKERIKQITPSSRYWQYYGDEICRLQPFKKIHERPLYFFDA